MTFKHNNGRMSLFKNDRKEKDTHPDYKGDGVLLDGSEVWLSAWDSKSKSGQSYLSISITQKNAEHSPAPSGQPKKVEVEHAQPFDDEIPF